MSITWKENKIFDIPGDLIRVYFIYYFNVSYSTFVLFCDILKIATDYDMVKDEPEKLRY